MSASQQTAALVGSRIVVTGMAGAGKSTLSLKLAAKTGLPLIHLDLHSWKPGWVRVSDDELLETQRILMVDDQWIIDSNDVDDDLLLANADTLVVLTTPWWICSARAFRRGLRRPRGSVLPDGCDESFTQRIGDEWGIVWRNFRNHKAVHEKDSALMERCRGTVDVHAMNSKQEVADFLSRVQRP